MDDTCDLDGNPDFDSAYYENKITTDFLDKQRVTFFKYPLNATSIVIPATHSLPERKLSFDDIEHKHKVLLYRLIVAAYNYSFTDDFAPASSKESISTASSNFVGWLNNTEIDNPYSILKDYERYYFDKRNNHGGSSELHKLKLIFTYALERSEEFYSSLTLDEWSYLLELKKTKISPNLNKKQISLASYFGALDWLREEDLGIGNQLYQTLASPKMTVNSLKLTTSSIIIELYIAKYSLRKFIKNSGLTASDFEISDYKDMGSDSRIIITGKYLYRLLSKYHEEKSENIRLRNALELVLLSNVTNLSNFEKVRPALDSKEQFESIFLLRKGKFSKEFARRTFNSVSTAVLLSLTVIRELAIESNPLPITQLEMLMFSWLMACMTVQPSDIQKLSKQSFRLLRLGRRVTHIECEYFKGRSNAIHSTCTVSTRKLEGQALQLYLKQHRGNELSSFNGAIPVMQRGLSSLTGLLNALLMLSYLSDKMRTVHQQRGKIPAVIPIALSTLLAQGTHTENVVSTPKKLTIDKRQELVSKSKTPCNRSLFSLQAIKNSAVHAYSDPYTLFYLINHNSHTNQTEKRDYLTADNEEWMNAAGRITRSVMLDLINNVFDLDFKEMSDEEINSVKTSFNNEFANVTDTISYKSGEIISRLKIITEQGKGVINEIGVLSLSAREEDTFAPIFILDSKVTTFKMFNYLHEFKKNYKKLLNRNPDYLYQTVLPTVEWMEHALTNLSKQSIRDGKQLFQKMYDSGVSISIFHSI